MRTISPRSIPVGKLSLSPQYTLKSTTVCVAALQKCPYGAISHQAAGEFTKENILDPAAHGRGPRSGAPRHVLSIPKPWNSALIIYGPTIPAITRARGSPHACYKGCMYGWGDADLTMLGVFPPRSNWTFGRGETIPRADPNPGGLAGATRCAPFPHAA